MPQTAQPVRRITRSTLKHRFRQAAGAVGSSVAAAGLLVLALRELASGLPAWVLDPLSSANTAFCLFLLGSALTWRARRPAGRLPVAAGASILAALIALTTMAEYASGRSLDIDNLLGPSPAGDSAFPGRMSVVGSVAILLLALSSALESLRTHVRETRLPQALAISGFLVGLLALLGTIWHAPFFLHFDPSYGAIAPMTTCGVLATSVALLLLQPSGPVMDVISSTSTAGREARTLVFTHLPVLLLLIAVIAGWESSGRISATEAASLSALALLVALLAWGWRTFRGLDRAERDVRRALQETEQARQGLQDEVIQRTVALTTTTIRAEAARAQLQAIMESAPDQIAAIDTDYRFVVTNKAYVSALRDDQGVNVVSGMRYDDAFRRPDEAREQGRQWWGRALSGERFTCEGEIPQPNGSVIAYERAFGPVRDGNGKVIGAVGVLRDITSRRSLERELGEKRRLIEAILHHTGTGVFVKAESGRYLLANPVFAKMCGHPPADIPGKTDYALFPPEVACIATMSDRFAVENRVSHEREVVLSGSGHEQRTYLVSKVPIPDGNGGWWICGVATDITERKQAEAALRQSELRLEGRNRDLETLLHVVSHDLKEPLRSIESFSRLLATRHTGQLDERGLDYFERVVKSTGRMGQLLEEIQLLSRARQAETTPEQVDGDEVVREVLARLDGAIRETNSRITIQDPMPRLGVQRVWATQALYNLVANALKFRRGNTPAEIQVVPWFKRDRAGFQVLDRGPGVPPEQRERIFQLFQRGVGREIPGTGAGLAIVRQIAERHGGEAWVEPREGGGSVFTVTFASDGGRAA